MPYCFFARLNLPFFSPSHFLSPFPLLFSPTCLLRICSLTVCHRIALCAVLIFSHLVPGASSLIHAFLSALLLSWSFTAGPELQHFDQERSACGLPQRASGSGNFQLRCFCGGGSFLLTLLAWLPTSITPVHVFRCS